MSKKTRAANVLVSRRDPSSMLLRIFNASPNLCHKPVTQLRLNLHVHLIRIVVPLKKGSKRGAQIAKTHHVQNHNHTTTHADANAASLQVDPYLEANKRRRMLKASDGGPADLVAPRGLRLCMGRPPG